MVAENDGLLGKEVYPEKMAYWQIEEQLRLLSGKILTFIDMAVVDKQSNKAWKDVVKQEFYKRFGEIQYFCSNGVAASSIELEQKDTDRLA